MKKIVDGNKVAAIIAAFFSELAIVYPITPSSPMASEVDYLLETKKLNAFNSSCKVVEMQSEAGVSGAMHGALINGVLTTTFTSSQGLLLMLPNIYKMAGEGLPGVIHVAARTIATSSLSIYGDHSDIYSAMNTGAIILASNNQKEIEAFATVAHLASVKVKLPFIHFFDGFRTSHELNTIDSISDEDLLKLFDNKAVKAFKDESLDINDYQRGLTLNEDIFYQTSVAKRLDYLNSFDIINNELNKYNKLLNTNYSLYEYYGDKEATSIIVAIGSVNDTIKEVVDYYNNLGNKYGVISYHLVKPASKKYFLEALPKSVKNIAVLERTNNFEESGNVIYKDIVSMINNSDIKVTSGSYGISSKNTNPSDIAAVFKMLDNEIVNNFNIGIIDDVTNSSLEKVDIDVTNNCLELLIYGFGSDGIVSASKDLLSIIGNNTSKYVHGYFKYDSKKSGGLTTTHIRINDTYFNKPYYTTKPKVVVVTKDSYLLKYHLFDSIINDGIVIINTSKTIDEISKYIASFNGEQINNKHLKIILIDATKIASDNKINGKISKIMEAIILKTLGYSELINIMKDNIKVIFKTKGMDIINANLSAIDAINDIKVYDQIKGDYTELLEDNDVISIMNRDMGDNLVVSKLLPYKNGIFKNDLTKYETRNISEIVPIWDKDKCVQCNMCASICPHAVIRPVINKNNGIPLLEDKNKLFNIVVNTDKCTGCALCSNICPTKAITMGTNKTNNNLDSFYQDELSLANNSSIKYLQYFRPKFQYSGACSGCGETNYIKVLTQLFGNSLLIANATGCSSIYGGSAPSTPYSIPWANSLFEDNAEFGYGMYLADKIKKEYIKKIINNSLEAVTPSVKELYLKYLDNSSNYAVTHDLLTKLKDLEIPIDLKENLANMDSRSIWCIGGDGWAYDIGFSGIDHILSTNENINILVLDTETYSNTGGQASKATPLGAVGEFANLGKRTNKKDLFKIATCYDNVYVASICYGADMLHTIKVLKEAESHQGPSIVIAYCPCIEQGISGGMINSISEQKLAVKSGYTLLMRYTNNKLIIDSQKPDFSLLDEFFNHEVRFKALKIKDEQLANKLLSDNKEYLEKRYNFYLNMISNS